MKTIVQIQIHAMANTWSSKDAFLYQLHKEEKEPQEIVRNLEKTTGRKYVIGKIEDLHPAEYTALETPMRIIQIEDRSAESVYQTKPNEEAVARLAREIRYKAGYDPEPPEELNTATEAKKKKEQEEKKKAGCIFWRGFQELRDNPDLYRGSLSEEVWTHPRIQKEIGGSLITGYLSHPNRTHKTDAIVSGLTEKYGLETVVGWIVSASATPVMDYIDPFVKSPLYKQDIDDGVANHNHGAAV